MGLVPVVGQAYPSAGVLTTIFTFPARDQSVVLARTLDQGTPTLLAGDFWATMHTLVVCNQQALATTFRLSFAPLGAADTAAQYLYYDAPLQANDTFSAQFWIPIARTDVFRGRSANGYCSFQLFGQMDDGRAQ
jgi:hypothetical protein